MAWMRFVRLHLCCLFTGERRNETYGQSMAHYSMSLTTQVFGNYGARYANWLDLPSDERSKQTPHERR